MQIKKERFKIYENDEHVGYFNVACVAGVGRQLTADLFAPCDSFLLLPDENGHVSEQKTELWIIERIIPKTRVGLEDNLRLMGLTEYDELAILKYTEGRYASDNCWIDFTQSGYSIDDLIS